MTMRFLILPLRGQAINSGQSAAMEFYLRENYRPRSGLGIASLS